ncbi:MAG: hypothetical protein E7429_00025 [Ruminococcaceae bacterium]|nr:hypothetical protein [Oscillospiraceae bacterium]
MRMSKDFKMGEWKALKNAVCEKTGRYLGNGLLGQAFTRRSYTAEHGGENNEILEFIGDRVLDDYVVKALAKRYGARKETGEYVCRVRENRLAELKQELVSNKTLAAIVDEWGIEEYLFVGKSDYNNWAEVQEKAKADLFEAILGAIAVESDWDAAVLEQTVEKMLSLDARLQVVLETEQRLPCFRLENAVTTLKELAEQRECPPPVYEFHGPDEVGYDKDGTPVWFCTCMTAEWGIRLTVRASSKKAAKQYAAYLVLCRHYGLQNEYGPNRICVYWEYKDGKLIPGGEMKA